MMDPVKYPKQKFENAFRRQAANLWLMGSSKVLWHPTEQRQKNTRVSQYAFDEQSYIARG